MSKRELKKYLTELNKTQLEAQILDLYDRFKDVKTFYDFAFNPNENKLLEDCKFKISKEYFPPGGRKAKMRRSVAQKYIRHFKTLGVEPNIIADIMLFNIEIAQTYTAEHTIRQDAFYLSMLKSFQESLVYISDHGLIKQMQDRIDKIVDAVIEQNWFNALAFENAARNLFE